MPFWRTRRYRWHPRRQRKWRSFRKRRPRTTFQRRFRRRTTVRKYRKRKKKLLKITEKQFQPKIIEKCKIHGSIPLFVCGRTRSTHDYTLWKESISPAGEATGGGWSIQQFTLSCLYNQYIKYRNFWTKSNKGLPLSRYTGATLKCFKSPHCDYIVRIVRNPPFSVTRDMFLDTHPQRMMLYKHKYIIPQLTSGTRKKYKKIKVRPPALMSTNWYFTQDICKAPLLNIITSSCSLQQPYIPEDQVSNELTLYSLDTNFFQNTCFEKYGTKGYSPRQINNNDVYIFKPKLHATPNAQKQYKWKDMIPLTETNEYFDGLETISALATFNNKNSWGNPFTERNAHIDQELFYTNSWPTDSTWDTYHTFTPLEYIYWQCRYNPEKDNGTGNIVYLKSNNDREHAPINVLPDDPELVIRDYPLWLTFWGFMDWLQKLKPVQQIDTGYMFVVVSKFISPPKPYYLFLDRYFVSPKSSNLTASERLKWHPMYTMQTEVEYFFGTSGPFSPKVNRSQSIQANLDYYFYFKWGGCPAPMQTIIAPENQDKFPNPYKINETIEIENPKLNKKHHLYEWDERRGEITTRCAKRLKKDSETELSFTESNLLDPPIQALQKERDQTQTSEEETETLQQQLQQLRYHHLLLKRQLHRLTKQPTSE